MDMFDNLKTSNVHLLLYNQIIKNYQLNKSDIENTLKNFKEKKSM